MYILKMYIYNKRMIFRIGNALWINWLYKRRRCKECGGDYYMVSNNTNACYNNKLHR
jgi:hypothetical protein